MLAVCLDFSKAFDTYGNHEILLRKLGHIGIRGNVESWFKSYLTCRNQTLYISGKKDCKLSIISGVPQGSIFGLLLFIIYIIDEKFLWKP